jgi:RNA polymerase sigma factor (TIGR02999 family)
MAERDFFIAMSEPAEITALLRAWGNGDPAALDRLTALVYNELRRMAGRYMRKESAGNTLQTTALVNEAYLRLVDMKDAGWNDRLHFFAVSAQVMRRILVDAARARGAMKRGGAAERVAGVDFDRVPNVDTSRAAELVALEDALEELASIDPRKARVVELRFFGGLSVEETATVLNVSSPTVLRDWRLAKAWLMRSLSRR